MEKDNKGKDDTINHLLIGRAASHKVNELIAEGWEFTLHYGNHRTYCDIQEPCWEADFTRKKDNGLWDNHKCGYGHSPDFAIKNAYTNIKNGVKLNKVKLK